MSDPSVVATSRLSLFEPTLDETNRTPWTPSAAAFARNSRSAFSSMGTSNGSVSCGVTQRPSGTAATGASVVSAGATSSLARAIATASRAARATASRVNSRVAVNPHDPLTSARTPMPYDSLLLTPVIRSSRALTDSVQ